MDLTLIIEAIQNSGFAEWMRMSRKSLPIVEAAHVMAIAAVFGSIFIVDLRLLGYPGTGRAFTRVADELLRWTWGAFALAVITGVMMFAANAVTYSSNVQFQLKMVALALAGINMAEFQFITIRGVKAWDVGAQPPPAARFAGLASIMLWLSVIFLGRWIGFTKGYDFEVPDDMDFDFDFSLVLDLLHLA